MTIKLIDEFESLTKQQMFDMAAAHVRSVRVKSYNAEGLSRYCVYSGIGCAASVFLADEESKKEADELYTNWMMVAEQTSSHNAEFIVKLQECHDDSEPGDFFMHEYEKEMAKVALEFDLKY